VDEKPDGAGEGEPGADVFMQSEDVDLAEPSAPSITPAASVQRPLEPGVRRALARPGLIVLLAANLLPLVGVLALGWQVFPIMLLYWIENIVVGCFTVLKIGTARGVPTPDELEDMPGHRSGRRSWLGDRMSRVALQLLFIFNYGIFTLAQGMFVYILFSGRVVPQPGPPWSASAGLNALWLVAVVCGLVVSHAVSYRRNWLASGRYLTMSPVAASRQPVGRLLVLHITIIAAGWFVDWLGAPVGGLLVLVVLKTVLDTRGYLKQHRVAVG
jgi:hypothetical protein